MKNLFYLLAAVLMVSCGSSKSDNSSESVMVADNPEEIYALDSVPFFVSEMEFDAISGSILAKFENPNWKDNMLSENPYIMQGYGFNNVRGIFSQPDGKLIGLVFRYTDTSENDTEFVDNWEALKSYLAKEYGTPTDKHTGLTMNDVEQKGEIATEQWNMGKKSILTTISYNGEHFGVNLFIYRNDKINPDTTSVRRIDGDLIELRNQM